MKDGVKDIIGKRICGVVEKRGNRGPKSQVFLLFDDGTYYEFWSGLEKINGITCVKGGGREEVHNYISDVTEVVFEAHQDSAESDGE